MLERDHNGLPPELRDATRVLRETPPANDLWRQRLLREIEAAPHPRTGDAPARGRWQVRPSVAVAAGLVCALLGGATTAVLYPRPAASIVESREPRAESVRFTLVAPNASHVSIVGDFNGWNASALPLRRSSDGRLWEVEIPLRPGRYAYSFVVDGSLAPDPSAPQAPVDDFGGVNSVVMVKGS